MLGRGLVEPVDDFRATNPPTNPRAARRPGQALVEQKFDLRALIRTICRVARLSAQLRSPTPPTTRDEQNYSRALLKRMDAEVLLDAVCQATGVPEKFDGVPAGTRAIELWDSQVEHYFLRLFGRPVRQTACECERVVEPSVAQVLHLLNSRADRGQAAARGRPRGRAGAASEAATTRAGRRTVPDVLQPACRPTPSEQTAVEYLSRSQARQTSPTPRTRRGSGLDDAELAGVCVQPLCGAANARTSRMPR